MPKRDVFQDYFDKVDDAPRNREVDWEALNVQKLNETIEQSSTLPHDDSELLGPKLIKANLPRRRRLWRHSRLIADKQAQEEAWQRCRTGEHLPHVQPKSKPKQYNRPFSQVFWVLYCGLCGCLLLVVVLAFVYRLMGGSVPTFASLAQPEPLPTFTPMPTLTPLPTYTLPPTFTPLPTYTPYPTISPPTAPPPTVLPPTLPPPTYQPPPTYPVSAPSSQSFIAPIVAGGVIVGILGYSIRKVYQEKKPKRRGARHTPSPEEEAWREVYDD